MSYSQWKCADKRNSDEVYTFVFFWQRDYSADSANAYLHWQYVHYRKTSIGTHHMPSCILFAELYFSKVLQKNQIIIYTAVLHPAFAKPRFLIKSKLSKILGFPCQFLYLYLCWSILGRVTDPCWTGPGTPADSSCAAAGNLSQRRG